MIIVVTQVNVHYLLPRWLYPLRDLFQKADGHAFEDFESIRRFVGGLQQWLKDKHLSHKYMVDYHESANGGIIKIVRPSAGTLSFGNLSSEKPTVMLAMKFFRPYGHVSVSKDGQSLYRQKFIQEEE